MFETLSDNGLIDINSLSEMSFNLGSFDDAEEELQDIPRLELARQPGRRYKQFDVEYALG